MTRFVLLLTAILPDGAFSTHTLPAAPCHLSQNQLPRITLVDVHTGTLAPGESTCLALDLDQGELARLAISAEVGYLRARVLAPGGRELLRSWTSSFPLAAPSPIVVVEATAAGGYVLELSVPAWAGIPAPQAFRVHIATRESARSRAARRDELQRDPRVAWLRTQAHRLRTVYPDDTDFGDLQFLRDALKDTRVVLLGEGENGGGSDVMAKTRLVRFLHEQMGFDAIAFQTGMHSSMNAWTAFKANPTARPALLATLPALLHRSAEGKSLIEYLTLRARSRQPLEVFGFDSQLNRDGAALFLPDLRRALEGKAIDSALLDSATVPGGLLKRVLGGGVTAANLPSAAHQAETVAAIRSQAARLEQAASDAKSRFWAQVLRSTAAQVELQLNSLRGAAGDYMPGLTRQLGDNLVWLLNHKYAERKVIVWVHTLHAMRSPEATRFGQAAGSTVGQAVWTAFGAQTFSIGFTSYDGVSHWVNQPDDYYQTIIPNQHRDDAFETLMAAAGHDLAFVNLRSARQANSWPGGRFVANALYLVPEEAEWSRSLDALFFIRTQAPRHRVE